MSDQELFSKTTDMVTALQNGVRAINNLQQRVNKVFPQATGTTATASAGAATLPANPVGFIQVYVPSLGSTVKIPYYAT